MPNEFEPMTETEDQKRERLKCWEQYHACASGKDEAGIAACQTIRKTCIDNISRYPSA